MRTTPLVTDELELLQRLVPLQGASIVELGCGAARLARSLIQAYPDARYVGYEVDSIQLAKNLADAPPRMQFRHGGAEATQEPSGSCDLILMLKSLHHVDLAGMDRAFAEMARVLRPGGHLYISEPVYEGALNEVIKLFNDEGTVRAQAQLAIDRALAAQPSLWTETAVERFDMPVHFRDFASFERRMLYPTFKDLGIRPDMLDGIRQAFQPHCGPDGAHFVRPMLVRLLQRIG
jgi:SAM-dependent methyltransferase